MQKNQTDKKRIIPKNDLATTTAESPSLILCIFEGNPLQAQANLPSSVARFMSCSHPLLQILRTQGDLDNGGGERLQMNYPRGFPGGQVFSKSPWSVLLWCVILPRRLQACCSFGSYLCARKGRIPSRPYCTCRLGQNWLFMKLNFSYFFQSQKQSHLLASL